MKLSIGLGTIGAALVGGGVYLLLGIGAAMVAVGLPALVVGVLRDID